MPEKETVDRANQDLREGKSPSTAAGEFVREEMDHIREGKHGASSPQQAIAIGLSKARRSGIPLKPQGKTASQKSEERDYRKGQSGSRKKASAKRSRASRAALKRKPRRAASAAALSRQAKSAAKKRGATSRKKAAAKATRTRQRRAA